MTSTEVHGYIQPHTMTRLNPVMVGRALNHFKFEKLKHAQKQVYGYFVRRLKM
jgi:hypothetical protein